MPRKTPALQLEIMPGKSSIDSAWSAALPTLAEDLTVTIRRLVAEGYFVVKDGKMIRNPERMKTDEKEVTT